MRLLNICVLAMLVFAAAYVYEIKFESTLRAERIAKMRGDIRRERDAIAALRAEWATLGQSGAHPGPGAAASAAAARPRPDAVRLARSACRSGRRRSCSRRPTTRSPR